MSKPLTVQRPRLGDAFGVLGLSTEFAHWQTPFARAILNLGGNPRELGPFEALGYLGEIDPLAAWESLITHDLCPPEWQHDPRTFSAEPEKRRGMKLPELSPIVSSPPTLRACVTLASDPQGVARAEELAREFSRSRFPEAPTVVRALAWRVARSSDFIRTTQSFRTNHAEALVGSDRLRDVLDQLDASHYGIVRLDGDLIELIAPDVESCAWWSTP